ncbi:MAG: HAMP domain-containing histidine kinase, partial [Thermoproteota archaeon]|nr:HAMP domain-containing histidine kinase [Thermoproteota archaeon]
NIPPLNFTVSNLELLAAIEITENEYITKSMLYSNEPSYLNHFKNLFDGLWKTSKDPHYVIKSIKEQTDISFIKTIESSEEAFILIRSLMTSARFEILGILPSINSFCRQIEYGMIQHIKNIALLNKNITIKVLITEEIDDQKQQDINLLLNKYGSSFQNKNSNNLPLDYQIDNIENLKIRAINRSFQTEMALLVVDKNKSIITESINDSVNNSLFAIGMTSYSNSTQISKSYKAIIDNLWNQTEMYEQIKQAHEHLKIQDKMQKEFINIAAHELRTPIQPILGLSEIVKDNTKDKEQQEILDIVIRNIKKLKILSENILDVTRIEGNLFDIDKEEFSLNNLILNISKDFENNSNEKKKVQFEYNNFNKEYLVIADITRIGQVISNLIDNSVKNISKDGTISLTIEKGIINAIDNDIKEIIIIHVKDNGNGINPEIYPRLFTKFATKSFQGTGLGLYICKRLVEAHGGKIWGKNNKDGNGATFSFSLPIKDQ